MTRRTSTLKLLPWKGGLVTSTDELLLQPGELTVADNVTFSYSDEKRRREGINLNWDDMVFSVEERSSTGTIRTLHGTFTNTGIQVGDLISVSGSTANYNAQFAEVTAVSGTEISYEMLATFEESITPDTAAYWANKVVGGIDYWFGSEDAKAQFLVTVLDNGAVYYNAQGLSARLTDTGTAWVAPLTEANLEVIQNRVIIAVSGLNNRVKHWNGDVSETLKDLPANLLLTSVERASSGTTRTLKFSGNIDLADGSEILINGGPAAYNGKYVIATGGSTDTITYVADSSLSEATTPDTEITIGTAAPLALFVREHAGALWANDKTRLDRLHYSGENIFQWGGIGISGALDIGEGDGDPAGLTGISPTFKSQLFVGKRTKLYRIDVGYNTQGVLDPDFSNVTKVSNGIGFLSHQGIVAIDQDDLFFVSDRGIHSMATTAAYGDFTAAYLSSPIQRTFVEDFTESRRKYIKAAYIPQINSAAFAVSENGSGSNNSIYLYNVQLKAWYRWPEVEAESLISAQDVDKRRIYLGTYRARLGQTMTNGNVDIWFDGRRDNIRNRIATGLMMPDDRPDTIKGFKNLRIVFRASGSYTITVKVKIDNFSEQAIAFISNEQAVPLEFFVLGEDVLGGSYVTAPYSLPIDGYGRAIKLTIEQNDLNTALAVQGFLIEYWTGEQQEETRSGDDR